MSLLVPVKLASDRSAWTELEKYTFKLLLQKFGIGQWKQIIDSGLLPGKFNSQMVGMTQRLLGAQSLAKYSGLRVDIDKVKRDNDSKQAVRKAKMIINEQAITDRLAIQQLRKDVQKEYGLSDERLAQVEQEIAQIRVLQHNVETSSRLLENLSLHINAQQGISRLESVKQGLAAAECFVDQACGLLGALQEKSAGSCQPPNAETSLAAAGTQAPRPISLGQSSRAVAVGDEQRASQPRSAAGACAKVTREKRKRPRSTQPTRDAGASKLIMQYVQQLQDMGFPKRMAHDALVEAEYDLDAAAVWLLQNVAQ